MAKSSSDPQCLTIKIQPGWSGPVTCHLLAWAWAVLEGCWLDPNKDANTTRAFMITSHPQYTHKEDSDKWLIAPLAHNASQSRYSLFGQALAAVTY